MTAKRNRIIRRTAAVLAVVAVGAGATACDGDAGAASAKSGAHAASQSGTQGSAGTEAKELAEPGAKSGAVNTTSASVSNRCHTGGLDYSWKLPHGARPDMDATSQQSVDIRLTNNSGHTCTLYGFPGVRLVSTSGETWDLRRSADKPSTITLHPGDSTAMVDFTILPVPKDSTDAKPFVPSKVLITPPNETSHTTLNWPYGGAVLDQSAATRPGTFVNPVVY